ncbi:MAG: tetratricopeptide repeat protein, partial [Candidatus Omnitrophica bacterium]|nr:tetratricopeptide repeat protein [Candidatus Omnitrophota bacterium]
YYLDYSISDQDTVFDRIIFSGDPRLKAGLLEEDFNENQKGADPRNVVFVDDRYENTEVIRGSFPATTIHLDPFDANNLTITRSEYISAAEEAAYEKKEEHVFENLINAFDLSQDEKEEQEVLTLAAVLLSPGLEGAFLDWVEMTSEFLTQNRIAREALRAPNGNGKRSEMRLFHTPVYARGGVYDMFLSGDLSLLANTHPDILKVLKGLKKNSEGLLIGPGFGYEILDIQKEFPDFVFRSVGERDFFGHKDLRANVEEKYGLAPREAQTRIEELKKNFLKADLKKTTLGQLYGSDRFDFVILGNGVMIYLPNKVRLIEDMYHVLKPGGVGFADGGGLVVLDEKDDLEAWRETQSVERDPAKTAAILNRIKGLEVKNQPLGIGSDRLLTGITFTKTAEPLELPLKLIEVNKNEVGRYQEVYRYAPAARSELRFDDEKLVARKRDASIPLKRKYPFDGWRHGKKRGHYSKKGESYHRNIKKNEDRLIREQWDEGSEQRSEMRQEMLERLGEEKVFTSERIRQLFAGAGAMSWLNLTDHIRVVFFPRDQLTRGVSFEPFRYGEGTDAVYTYRLPEDLTVEEALQWIDSVRKLPFSNGTEVLPVLAASITKLAVWMARQAMLRTKVSTDLQTTVSGIWAVGAALTHETLQGRTIPSLRAMAAGQPTEGVWEQEVLDWLGLTPGEVDRFRDVFEGGSEDILDVVLKRTLRIAAETVLLEVKALTYFRGSRLKKIVAERKGGRMQRVLREARKMLRDAEQAPPRFKLKAEKDVIAMIAERISTFPGWVRAGKEQTVLESSPTNEAINCVQRTALMAMYLEVLRKEGRKKGWFRTAKVFSVLSESHISLAVEFGNEKFLVDPSLRGSGEARFKPVDQYPSHLSVGPLKEGILFAYLCNVGEYLGEEGEFEGAVDAYRSAIRLFPKEGYALRDLGTYLYLQGQYAEASALFRDAIALIPHDVLTRTLLGLSLYAEERLEEAMEAYWDGQERPSGQGRVHAAFGKILFDHGLSGKAIDAYQRGLESAPDDATIHHALGNAFEKMEMLDQAVSEYREAVRISPRYAMAYRDLGRTLVSQAARSSGLRQLKLLEEARHSLIEASDIYQGEEKMTHKILAGLYEYWATLYPPGSAPALELENETVKHLEKLYILETERGFSSTRSEVRGWREWRQTDETLSLLVSPPFRWGRTAGRWLAIGTLLLALSIPQAWMAAWLGRQGSLEVNAREYSLKVITGEKRIREAVRSGTAFYVAPTGPFKEVENNGKKVKQPIGWIREGIEKNAFIPTTRSNSAMLKGVFLVDRNGRSRILPSGDFDPNEFPAARYPTSFQAGPMAIEGGVINFRIGKQHSGILKGRKVVVGVDSSGNVHVLDLYGFDIAGQTGPTTAQLVQNLMNWKEEKNIRDALFVDGGSTGLKVFQKTPAAALMAFPKRSEVRNEALPEFQAPEG